LYWDAEALIAPPLVPAVELEACVEDDGLAVLDAAPGAREPAAALALARMKLSALEAPAPVAVPDVPVADGADDDCRQPVMVTVWLERLPADGGCAEELPGWGVLPA